MKFELNPTLRHFKTSFLFICLVTAGQSYAATEGNVDQAVLLNNPQAPSPDTYYTTHPIPTPDPATTQQQSWLDFIPNLIDSTPTFLPPESNNPIVPSTAETENSTWTDQQQQGVRNWVDRTANKIDSWFGTPDPNKPAEATLRILLDNYYDEHNGYEIKPRIRGKIKLPTLQRKISVVFGDDSLDNELKDNVAISNENPSSQTDKSFDRKRTRDDNSSIALRWSELSKKLPFDVDADLGIRSGDDIYLRLKASKDWTLNNDFYAHAEQIYRYGIDSKNYWRTNLELSHMRPNQAMLSNQFYLTISDRQEDDFTWDNRFFRQHQFFQGNRFNYGLYTGGYDNGSNLRLNSWGPFVSWRQPVWREWFFVQGDLNYFNDDRLDRDHYFSTVLRLEALF
ncbi:hypothetical protein RFI36_16810 [Acinetobacter gerneri]|uniref:Selenocysteine synthase n=1 Tax=Acinetobacter gerneri TaxID=202952 RepID=A0AAW8JK14_9GAMM|nr:hypothetical protein [Acinetobacter gerneri]MDQ9011362.1 hypothetical protein [Acinetobacter gerneri]MDQ9015498.1 hypothetical protein [Acinetobacter gerneri]MDQ9026671.1 hypothetical protein [Acinetobacter gerneri]MDQ9053952.1 hypothetical protein [Acinetobacter gerneri]MDQ9061622.1 hypothetical protein [Acinetobacter gerneri]